MPSKQEALPAAGASLQGPLAANQHCPRTDLRNDVGSSASAPVAVSTASTQSSRPPVSPSGEGRGTGTQPDTQRGEGSAHERHHDQEAAPDDESTSPDPEEAEDQQDKPGCTAHHLQAKDEPVAVDRNISAWSGCGHPRSLKGCRLSASPLRGHPFS